VAKIQRTFYQLFETAKLQFSFEKNNKIKIIFLSIL